jgi:beta-glucosidase
LHHGPSPGWTRQVGGWDSPTIVGRIRRYVERVPRDLGDLIPYYCTINEANLRNIPAAPGVDVSPMRWEFPGNPISEWCRGLNLLFVTDKAQQKRACEAHVAMREAIKRTRPKAQFGTTVALLDGQSPGGDKLAKQMWDDLMESVAPYLKGDDFLGVQNYMRLGFLGKRLLPPERELTDMGYECYPEALANVLREASQLGLPLIVTESGYPGEDDTKRIEFIDRVLQGVEACLRDGIDVRGYTYWSLLDNGDWDFDYGKKFGLIAVDHATQHRTVKPSARHLGAIAQRGLGRRTTNAAALSTFELAKEVSRDARG